MATGDDEKHLRALGKLPPKESSRAEAFVNWCAPCSAISCCICSGSGLCMYPCQCTKQYGCSSILQPSSKGDAPRVTSDLHCMFSFEKRDVGCVGTSCKQSGWQ